MRLLLPALLLSSLLALNSGCGSGERPANKLELMALQGFQGRVRQIDDAIAQVASGDAEKAKQIVQIAEAYRQFTTDLTDFRVGAGVPDDVALVGTMWVRVK